METGLIKIWGSHSDEYKNHHHPDEGETSEMWVNVYQTTLRNNSEGSHLQGLSILRWGTECISWVYLLLDLSRFIFCRYFQILSLGYIFKRFISYVLLHLNLLFYNTTHRPVCIQIFFSEILQPAVCSLSLAVSLHTHTHTHTHRWLVASSSAMSQ
jgi:hypothetical protein